jgi:hypothetical protein
VKKKEKKKVDPVALAEVIMAQKIYGMERVVATEKAAKADFKNPVYGRGFASAIYNLYTDAFPAASADNQKFDFNQPIFKTEKGIGLMNVIKGLSDNPPRINADQAMERLRELSKPSQAKKAVFVKSPDSPDPTTLRVHRALQTNPADLKNKKRESVNSRSSLGRTNEEREKLLKEQPAVETKRKDEAKDEKRDASETPGMKSP